MGQVEQREKVSDSKMIRLSAEQRVLLLLVLSHRRSPLLNLVQHGDPCELPLDLRNDIRDEIGSDLAEYGFNNTEPNELGFALEGLIDVLGPRPFE